MNFELTDTQKAIQKLTRDFAIKELAPGVAERDEKAIFDRAMYDRICELGICGIPFPTQYGGSDAGYFAYMLACEEICKVDDGVGAGVAVNIGIYGGALLAYGSEEQRQKWMVPMIKDKKIGAFALTEPGAGSDAAMQQTSARKDGKKYILNGNKIFITNASAADYYIVFAMTDKSLGVKGISAFLLEKGTPGFTFGKIERKMGLHSSITGELIFQDVVIPAANLLGQEGQGFKIAMSVLDGGRITVAAQALGIAESALEHAIKYSKERVQFGKPVAANQAIQFMLVDMAAAVEASRWMIYNAAWLKEMNKPFGKEAAMAKLYATDTAMRVTTDAVQIFGGYGYIKEYPVERLMRNAKITQIYEGSNQIQRVVLAGALLR
jgi:alkylation response protein AidB-like acyl-CoA dehydrogenase